MLFFNRFRDKALANLKAAVQTHIPLHTPDIAQLEQSKEVRLFDYGADCSKIWDEVYPGITLEHMGMWNRVTEKGTPPLVLNRKGLTMQVEDSNGDQQHIAICPRGRILGSIYSVPVEDIVELDKRRENGVLFCRKKVPIITPQYLPSEDPHTDIFNREGTPVIENVYMYVGIKAVWGEQVRWDHAFYGGRGDFQVADCQEIYSPWVGRYYKYKPTNKLSAFRKTFLHLRSNE